MAKIEKKYDGRSQLTVLKVTGLVTADDIIAAIDQHYEKNMAGNILWDFLDAATATLTTEDFKAIAQAAQGRINEGRLGKTALVAGTNFNIGLGVMYRAIAAMAGIAHDYKFFRNRADAVQWLNSPN